MFDKFRKSLSKLITSGLNSMSLPKEFLKYGNRGMRSDWTDVVMSDADLYTGYGYAAIRNRANKVARIATKEITTESSKKNFEHPYIETISKSPTFSNYNFWQSISTYLDLEGVYYLMAIRAVSPEKVGHIKEFKLLNPYNIRRVMDKDGINVGGYIETKNGFVREIPKEMIILIQELNPFDENKPYAMTDAAKESQFTLKTANDYTRHSLRNNINAPGILSTDVALEKEDFENFVKRVKNHKKGEPIFGNGGGAIKWEGMQTQIKDAGLKEINEINRDSLFAVSGVSKTLMGIEQSGTTRETSNVQKDLNTEDHILPRIQLIIDAFNQDYKNYYPLEYKSSQANIVVNNPLATDHDADLKANEVKTGEFELYTTLINKGYD
ncbi:MAG: phage portal protein, partial [Lutibacter sp.]